LVKSVGAMPQIYTLWYQILLQQIFKRKCLIDGNRFKKL
jgi:hypothetical protein